MLELSIVIFSKKKVMYGIIFFHRLGSRKVYQKEKTKVGVVI
jgi:hypothetical protein